MIAFKSYLKIAVPGILVVFLIASCKNNEKDPLLTPPQSVFKKPTARALVFDKPVKINWNAVKAIPATPVVEPFNLNKFPQVRYDSIHFKPLAKPVEETKFNFDSLPGHALDVDKLPSRPIEFTTYLLPPPKVIKTGPPHLKNQDQSLYGFSGVLQGSATTMITDHAGFLWIATSQGLYRYDGENLFLYIKIHSGDQIYSMMEDYAGHIWYNTQSNNLFVFDPRQDILKKYKHGMTGTGVTRMLQDDQHRIWLTIFGGGLNVIDDSLKSVKWIGQQEGLSIVAASGIARDIHNNIWVGMRGGGVNIVDLAHKKVRYLSTANGLKIDTIAGMVADREGRVWLGSFTNASAACVDISKGSIHFIQDPDLSNKSLWNLTEDAKGKIWIGTFDNGSVIIDPDNWTTMHMDMKSGLNGSTIQSIVLDKRGQLWIASSNGLDMISAGIMIDYIGNSGLSNFAEDKDGLLWDAIYAKGIAVIDGNDKTYRSLSAPNVISNDSLQTIVANNKGIFICSNGGLDIIDSTKTTVTHLNRKAGLTSRVAYTSVVDRKGLIWISEHNGLDIYDPKASTIKHLGKAEGLKYEYHDYLLCDKQNRIWVGNHTGSVTMIDQQANTIQNLKIETEAKVPGTPAVLQLDKYGNVWIGTRQGILIAGLNDRTSTSFSTDQGLISNQVNSLLERGGRMYVGTNDGISVVSPPTAGISSGKNWSVSSFGKAYGIIKTNPDTYSTDLITKDGQYLWGDNGTFILDLSKEDTAQSATYISGVRIMDKQKNFNGRALLKPTGTDTLWEVTAADGAVQEKSLLDDEHLQLANLKWDTVAGPYNMPVSLHIPYNQNFLQFQFNSLNLGERDNNQYRYILIGLDKKWGDITNDLNTQNYFNLEPGKYTFAVTSRSINGTWSQPAILSFAIDPPWWRTWWAYILFALSSGAIIYGFVYYRSWQLIKEKRRLEHKISVRTEEVMQQKEEMEAQRDDLEKAFGELKDTQRQLIHSEKMASLGELTAGIAHEIQNPLNFVNNFSEVNVELIEEIKEELASGNLTEALAIIDDLNDNERKITMHGKRADAIVKGMLQHSNSGGGAKEPTDVNKLADEYLRLSYHGLRAKDKTFNAEMITNFDPALPMAKIIAQDIGRVLLNLFNNAFYATNKKQSTAGNKFKPILEVSTHAENGFVVVKVKDNGIGIPDAIKDKIMQPFFTTKPTGEGTGLGLSLTYDMVVKSHGGAISVESTEGVGTEFTISLPIA